MKRKNYWFLFAILLLSLTSLSQGQNLTSDSSRGEERKTSVWNPQPASPEDTDPKPIRVVTHVNESDFNTLLDLNKAFVSETGIQVELKNMPDADAYRQLTAALKVGEGPDIMLVNSPWIHPLALGGYILPAESYQSSTTGSDVISPVSQMLEWNGYQWGVPLDMDPYVLVWRRQAALPGSGDACRETRNGRNSPPSWKAARINKRSPFLRGTRMLLRLSWGLSGRRIRSILRTKRWKPS
ncbi:Bacterial extracellular solute-binding protein [Paenibacillus sp. P1XP2]|nr:Bacterial extracellular solute-binding protein [Paenibacillus sp. P1XP2]